MKIIFCYSKVPDSRAEAAIRKYAPDAEFVETPGLFGYNEAIASRWGQDDLIVIEGDKEITCGGYPLICILSRTVVRLRVLHISGTLPR